LIDTIATDCYPRSPRIRLLQAILGKCGEIGGLSPELAARLRRYGGNLPPARGPEVAVSEISKAGGFWGGKNERLG